MANYVERNLRPSERIVAKAQISWVAIVPSCIWGALFTIIGLGIASQRPLIWLGVIIIIAAVVSVVITALRISSIELGVTDKKIIGKTGVIVANSLDAYLEKIDNFSISETLGGKIFGYATIMICTTSSKIRFPFIKNAMSFKNLVMDCFDAREQQKMFDQAHFINNGKRSGPSAPLPTMSGGVNVAPPAAPAPVSPAPSVPPVPPAPAAAPVSKANAAPSENICPNCGASNAHESSFCIKCGQKLS